MIAYSRCNPPAAPGAARAALRQCRAAWQRRSAGVTATRAQGQACGMQAQGLRSPAAAGPPAQPPAAALAHPPAAPAGTHLAAPQRAEAVHVQLLRAAVAHLPDGPQQRPQVDGRHRRLAAQRARLVQHGATRGRVGERRRAAGLAASCGVGSGRRTAAAAVAAGDHPARRCCCWALLRCCCWCVRAARTLRGCCDTRLQTPRLGVSCGPSAWWTVQRTTVACRSGCQRRQDCSVEKLLLGLLRCRAWGRYRTLRSLAASHSLALVLH